MSTAFNNTMNYEKRFNEFVTELEKLSAKYGIILEVTGGVVIYDEGDIDSVRYTRDHTSGDLNTQQIYYTSDNDETQSMKM